MINFKFKGSLVSNHSSSNGAKSDNKTSQSTKKFKLDYINTVNPRFCYIRLCYISILLVDLNDPFMIYIHVILIRFCYISILLLKFPVPFKLTKSRIY